MIFAEIKNSSCWHAPFVVGNLYRTKEHVVVLYKTPSGSFDSIGYKPNTTVLLLAMDKIDDKKIMTLQATLFHDNKVGYLICKNIEYLCNVLEPVI